MQQNVPLAPFTTFKVGGPARHFVEVTTEAELLVALDWAKQNSQPIFILGGGSNLLISDSGFSGLVIKICMTAIRHRHSHDDVIFEVAAGEEWDAFVAHAVAHHCSGIENLSGIPGTVGGTPVQNVGAYGQEV